MAGRIPKVVVVGPVYVDMAVKCERFPESGQIVDGSGFSCVPAGSGAYSAVQAALCGCESYLLGKVGDDLFGNMACQTLSRYGVNTDFVYKAPAISTGIMVTMVDALGENGCCLSQGANRALSSDEVGCALAEQLIASADACLIDVDLPESAVTTAIRVARMNRTRVILDAAVDLDEAGAPVEQNWPTDYYSADILVARIESKKLRCESASASVSEMKFVGTELVARGLQCVVLATGTRGVMIVERQGPRHIPGFDFDLVDHTACQDAFSGALVAACGSGAQPSRAAKFACAAAAIVCSRFGGLDSLARKEEIIELLQNQPD